MSDEEEIQNTRRTRIHLWNHKLKKMGDSLGFLAYKIRIDPEFESQIEMQCEVEISLKFNARSQSSTKSIQVFERDVKFKIEREFESIAVSFASIRIILRFSFTNFCQQRTGKELYSSNVEDQQVAAFSHACLSCEDSLFMPPQNRNRNRNRNRNHL
ncbi:uncharacterized protein MELLADRAFT_70711 [Melampsora larici-populina 98AG31]|uniref:Uncharacterized protein n=1 Tax=Melampsora larici-populina (strain 98AG31 / pathotype 3-4-7) TaxID=747676 RepID=F4R5V2_MELLP|nr:uncharacterized protein MELLADRAFT_70711 [Melampsora larici-populina 98AG31]EGG12103.1 hypothetical protein MELLADRAFT_70711 [Melampsora larici-populina 98AG31]